MSRVERREYITQEDGTLEYAGLEVYGESGKAPQLWGTNPTLNTTTKLSKGTRIVLTGARPPLTLPGKARDELTCTLDGREVPLQSARILITMDTGCDGWTGTLAWTPKDDPELDRVTKPFSYPRAGLYLGGNLVLGGVLYDVSPSLSTEGCKLDLAGYSSTADLIDSNVMPPYEINGCTLKQIAEHLSVGLGVKMVGDFGGAFTKVTANEGDKIFDFLSKLAAQRGGLVTNTREGDLLIWRANTDDKPLGTLTQGHPPVTEWGARYEGRKRWREYKCITAGVKTRGKAIQKWGEAKAGKSNGTLAASIIERDYDVCRPRFTTFRADDVTPGNVKHAARWKKNKHFADALTIELPVDSWYAPNGELWRVNTLWSVDAPVLRVAKGFTFLIRGVEFEYSTKGRTAKIHIVPPQVYSGKDLGMLWE